VGQLSQRVRLIHELAELRTTEEFPHCRDHRPDVNQRKRRRLLSISDGHSLAHDALHAEEADPKLVLDQLANGLHPAIAKMINIILALDAIVISIIRRMTATTSSLVSVRCESGTFKSSRRFSL